MVILDGGANIHPKIVFGRVFHHDHHTSYCLSKIEKKNDVNKMTWYRPLKIGVDEVYLKITNKLHETELSDCQ